MHTKSVRYVLRRKHLKKTTYDSLRSAPCIQCWQRHMTWLSYQHKEEELGKELTACLSSEGANVWLQNVVKKNICYTAERCITLWAGGSQFTARIPSNLAYIRYSDQKSCTPPHNYSRIKSKQEWPKVTLCQQETDSTYYPLQVKTADHFRAKKNKKPCHSTSKS